MKALVLVDIQYDFLSGGALAVAQGDEVIPVALKVIDRFPLVVSSEDSHPANHGSFAANHPGTKPGDVIQLDGIEQILWPVHCVQGTHGAKLAKEIPKAKIHKAFLKGTDPKIDSYSTFYDNAHRKSTGLGDYLKSKNVTEVYLLGLATDYCVKFSALDSVNLGFQTFVLQDGCRAVNLTRGDDERAWQEMHGAGVKIIHSSQLQESSKR